MNNQFISSDILNDISESTVLNIFTIVFSIDICIAVILTVVIFDRLIYPTK